MNKKFKITLTFFLILTILLFSLSGCYNQNSIDKLAYVVAIGFDVGENNKLKLSFQISAPSSSSEGGGSSQSASSIVTTIECASFNSGVNLLDSHLSKESNLSHCKIIVFSEEFANNGISDTLFTLMNNVQIRPDCNVLVSKNNAEYFLNNSKPVLEKLSARYYEIAPTSSEYTGLTENITLSEFFSDYTDTFSSCHAILGGISNSDTPPEVSNLASFEKDTASKSNDTLVQGKSNIENMGLAIFNKDKFVGELTGMETICHHIISGKLNTCIINIPSPFSENQTVSVKLQLIKKPKHKAYLVNGSCYFDSNIYLKARVLTMNENSNYLDQEYISILEKTINSYMESKLNDYLYKISKEFNSDIDGFGSYVVRNFSTYEEWKNFNWLANFKNSFFNVNVDTTVKSSYIIIES